MRAPYNCQHDYEDNEKLNANNAVLAYVSATITATVTALVFNIIRTLSWSFRCLGCTVDAMVDVVALRLPDVFVTACSVVAAAEPAIAIVMERYLVYKGCFV